MYIILYFVYLFGALYIYIVDLVGGKLYNLLWCKVALSKTIKMKGIKTWKTQEKLIAN